MSKPGKYYCDIIHFLKVISNVRSAYIILFKYGEDNFKKGYYSSYSKRKRFIVGCKQIKTEEHIVTIWSVIITRHL